MNKVILLALLAAAPVAFANEEATTTVVTTSGTSAPDDASFGTLRSSTTSRNATGQIVWSCTYKLAATSKTLTFRNGCPNKVKFEMKHR